MYMHVHNKQNTFSRLLSPPDGCWRHNAWPGTQWGPTGVLAAPRLCTRAAHEADVAATPALAVDSPTA